MTPLHLVSGLPFAESTTPLPNDFLVQLADVDNSIQRRFAGHKPTDLDLKFGGELEAPDAHRINRIERELHPIRETLRRLFTQLEKPGVINLPQYHYLEYSPFVTAFIQSFPFNVPSTLDEKKLYYTRGFWSFAKHQDKSFQQRKHYARSLARRRSATFDTFLAEHSCPHPIYLGLRDTVDGDELKTFTKEIRMINNALTRHQESLKYHMAPHFHPSVGYFHTLYVKTTTVDRKEELLRHIQAKWPRGTLIPQTTTPNDPDLNIRAHFHSLLTALPLLCVRRMDSAADSGGAWSPRVNRTYT